ncbi:MAG: DUF2437 domain-containing protein, partial [Acidobacteria bacterium]|nr:DUF2437 domain-containing protein [Acidobacteriota bacterium]
MKRFFRIHHNGQPRHVVEEEEHGEWRLIDGDIFGEFRAGDRLEPTGHQLLPPVM